MVAAQRLASLLAGHATVFDMRPNHANRAQYEASSVGKEGLSRSAEIGRLVRVGVCTLLLK